MAVPGWRLWVGEAISGGKIIQDVALNEELRRGTLVLHEISGEALEDMYQWGTSPGCSASRSEAGETQRLEEALMGADCGIEHLDRGTGRYGLDLEIPARYGWSDRQRHRWARRPLPRLRNYGPGLPRLSKRSLFGPDAERCSIRCSRLRGSICHSSSNSHRSTLRLSLVSTSAPRFGGGLWGLLSWCLPLIVVLC